MSVCMVCGGGTIDGRDICAYHVLGEEGQWAVANRILCDFFHRSIPPPRVEVSARLDSVPGATEGPVWARSPD